MKISEFLKALINVSEKGANIARIIRSESALLELLVQEKTGDQKNARFVQDFKTLADVLVQEVVRFDLRQQFPGIGGSIYGEESNKFTNTLGESVTIEIKDSPEKTKTLLGAVLDGNEGAAQILADVIHTNVNDVYIHDYMEMLDQNISQDEIGIWIDPIDSTAQYIHGQTGVEVNGMVSEGLQCATVLVGVYDKNSGLPIIGVVNQPFNRIDADGRWHGHIEWGVCYDDVKASSITPISQSQTSSSHDSSSHPTILISNSESDSIKSALNKDFELKHVAGAGYKLLGVCQGHADGYLLTKSGTFKWDSCAPHAILLSLGGSIVSFKELQSNAKMDEEKVDFKKIQQVKYNVPDDSESTGVNKWCNYGGIVAIKSPNLLQEITTTLTSHGTFN